VTQWRLNHFDAMHRFPLSIAMRQMPAIWEAQDMEIKGPTYAEEYASAAAARVMAGNS